MKKNDIVRAVDIVFRLRDEAYIDTTSYEAFGDWFVRSMALVSAYQGERFGLDDTTNTRMLHVFDNYSKDNPVLWTLIAYLLYNDIGDEYALSLYEHECYDDDYYIKMGSIIKETLEHE